MLARGATLQAIRTEGVRLDDTSGTVRARLAADSQASFGTQDIVFLPALGPRLHHFAYTVPESRDLFRACDIAGNLGFGDVIDRGPGRHGPSGALFVYFRDPAGHRVELFLNHYQIIDAEVEPYRWDARDQALALRWGMPPLHKWFAEATQFENVPVAEPPGGSNWYTLERKLKEMAEA